MIQIGDCLWVREDAIKAIRIVDHGPEYSRWSVFIDYARKELDGSNGIGNEEYVSVDSKDEARKVVLAFLGIR